MSLRKLIVGQMAKLICSLIFVFALSGVSYGYGMTVTGCPVSTEVKLDFNWYQTTAGVQQLFSTNMQYLYATSYGVGLFADQSILARTDASGSFKLSWATQGVVIQQISCTAANEVFTYKNMMFLIGSVVGVMFILGMKVRL